MEIVRFAVLGCGTGAVFGLLALSIVAVHRGSGVLNFGAGAIGMVGAYVFFGLRDEYGAIWPWPLAMAVSIAVCAAIGAAMHLLVMRRLVSAPIVSQVVATLGLMTLLSQIVKSRSSTGGVPVAVTSVLPTLTIELPGEINIGEDRLLIMGIAIVVTALLVVLERRTTFGLSVSAVAESRILASTMGRSPDLIGAAAWAIGGGLAASAAILVAPLASLSVDSLTLLVVPALAAGLFGRFQSYPWAMVGGLVLGIAESELSRYVSAPGWATAAPLLIIVGALAATGRGLPTRAESVERRPSVGSGRIRWASAAIALVAVVLMVVASDSWLDATTNTLIIALVVLSVVVLTGYAGQVSLAQFALSGMGAWFTAVLAVHAGWPLVLAGLAGAALCVPLGLVVALPALRARGSNLAIATLAMAVAIDALFLSNPQRTGSLAGKYLGPLDAFGLNFDGVSHPEAFAVLTLVLFALSAAMVANLRRGRVGRILLAVRSNEKAAASLGISVTGAKLFAFAVSALLAGLGGVLIEVRFGYASFRSFPVVNSINIVLEAVIGGVGWIAGSIAGATIAPGTITEQLLDSMSISTGWLAAAAGAIVIVIVRQAPDGVVPDNIKVGRWIRARLARGKRSRPQPKIELSNVPLSRGKPLSLEVDNVSVRFGSQFALRDVSLSIAPGEVVGLIGLNGAGKSTLVDVISGFQRPQTGTVSVNGVSIGSTSAHRRAQTGIARTFQSLELFEEMTVIDNVRTASEPCRARHYLTELVWPRRGVLSAPAQAAVVELGLAELLLERPDALNFAQRRLVAIARALASQPSLLMLDEPAAGLDRREREELVRLVNQIKSEMGASVVLVEHDVDLVFRLCDRIIVLDRGSVIADGTPDEVRRDRQVIEAYLGTPSNEGRDDRSEVATR